MDMEALRLMRVDTASVYRVGRYIGVLGLPYSG